MILPPFLLIKMNLVYIKFNHGQIKNKRYVLTLIKQVYFFVIQKLNIYIKAKENESDSER